MRFVQRDKDDPTKVIGHFANMQPGYAEEALPDDHPDIERYKQWRLDLMKPSAALHIAGTMRRSPYARGLARVLAERLGIPLPDLLALVIDAANQPPVEGAGVEPD